MSLDALGVPVAVNPNVSANVNGLATAKYSDVKSLTIRSNEHTVLLNELAGGSFPFAEHITDTTDTTSESTGALIVDGGAGIAKNLFVKTNTTLSGTTLQSGLLTATAGATFNARNTYKGVTSITAFAGGGQGSATALTGEQNNVTVCATAADSVLLPVASLGARIFVKNNGAADLAVFPTASGTINGGAASASITIPVGATKLFEGTTSLNWETLGIVTTAVGSAARPSHTFNSQSNQGLYSISSTQLGVAVAGALLASFSSTAGLQIGSVSEILTGSGITLKQNIIRQHSLTALNSTGTVTAAMVNKGGITSTSAAGVTATLDTAANIGTQIGAGNGTEIEFIVDNTAGANTVTVAVAAGITVCSGVVTGSDTLTVSVANAIGKFKLIFSGAAVAKLYRVG